MHENNEEKSEKSNSEEIRRCKEGNDKDEVLKSFEIENYIDKVNYDECVTLLKLRLNMIETKCNYKGKFQNDLSCPCVKLHWILQNI